MPPPVWQEHWSHSWGDAAHTLCFPPLVMNNAVLIMVTPAPSPAHGTSKHYINDYNRSAQEITSSSLGEQQKVTGMRWGFIHLFIYSPHSLSIALYAESSNGGLIEKVWVNFFPQQFPFKEYLKCLVSNESKHLLKCSFMGG